ncbi:MAG: tRNA (adenosine(37)-N6)-threonylcarbamoyltransferase complex dimerization subunit type 1 TsaB [Bacillota bacterium]|jgi:tRNA threonylcarbamoyladenosine biosynthesis protein TsaB
MKILALDTATRVAGAAIIYEAGILAESFLNTGKTHSQRLLSLINDMLSNADLTLDEMDGFAVTVGPGSFTGVRIGIATVKGFAQVLQKPVTPIITLDALAQNAMGAHGYICPILDARKNEVYTALYYHEKGIIRRLTEYEALSPDVLLKDLKAKKEPVTFLGDAVFVYRQLIEGYLGEWALFPSLSQIHLRAAPVAFLGMEKILKGDVAGVNDIEPFYLRKSEAEVKWDQAHEGGSCDGKDLPSSS